MQRLENLLFSYQRPFSPVELSNGTATTIKEVELYRNYQVGHRSVTFSAEDGFPFGPNDLPYLSTVSEMQHLDMSASPRGQDQLNSGSRADDSETDKLPSTSFRCLCPDHRPLDCTPTDTAICLFNPSQSKNGEVQHNSISEALQMLHPPGDPFVLGDGFQRDGLAGDPSRQHLIPPNSLATGMAVVTADSCNPPFDRLSEGAEEELRNHVLSRSGRCSSNSLRDIYSCTINIRTSSFTAAFLANGAIIGVSKEAMTEVDGQSPFYTEGLSKESAEQKCKEGFKAIKPDLRPVPVQLTRRHHPYIDALPFKSFRERVIVILGEFRLFEGLELFEDLLNGGLVCWSTTSGIGSPWDARSWEARPWFLKKWWMLLGGQDGEIYKQTCWWYELRGETPPPVW